MPKPILIFLLCTAYAMLNVTGAAFIKTEVSKHTLNSVGDYIAFLFTPAAIFGLSFIVLSALTLFKTLSMASFSLVIPLSTGINFVLTASIGYFIFKDHLSLVNVSGLLLIITGIILLSIK